MLTQHATALFVTGITHLTLAWVVFRKGSNRLTSSTYALYSVAIAWWSSLEAIAITKTTASSALFWWRLNHVGVIFIPIFFVHFVLSLFDAAERQKRKLLVRIIYGLGFVFLFLDATGLLIQKVVPKFYFRYFIDPGQIYPVFFVAWLGLAFYGLIELFRIYLSSSEAKRNQLNYFCWSMFFAYIGGVPNFLPTFNVLIPHLMPFGTYAIPVYAFATAYAIVRHQLMEIEVLV